MVDAIGWKTAGTVAKAPPAVTSTPAAAVSAPVKEAAATAPAAGSTTLAKTMAAAPPVDSDRVSRIKAAIAAGKFPILPSTIADRLIALKLNWDPNAKA
jgi:negative regulator of flagellin synthesis FlgM